MDPASSAAAPSSPLRLDRYLERVGLSGELHPDAETLRRLHRSHLERIPYENLDVQLGRPLTLDPAATYRKIVEGGRGGWCYEMNGLFAWALERIGFRLTRLAAGVMRVQFGDRLVGNHLALLVHLDGGDWLADVGFGDGLLEPVPLREGTVRQDSFEYRLERLDDGWWRFHNQPHSPSSSFDFEHRPADPALLERQCDWLQSSDQSPFVLNAVCQRLDSDSALFTLRGRVLQRVADGVVEKTLLASPAELDHALRERFFIELAEDDLATLWRKVDARHRQLFEHTAGGDPTDD